MTIKKTMDGKTAVFVVVIDGCALEFLTEEAAKRFTESMTDEEARELCAAL